ncbi:MULTISPECIES: hypothetical protein [unclassified Paenibacillus]|uniref:hypothetical protein n=1 Tax=unclassified Paenibacillus TaxID=185978 RepID=UPI00111588AC|nr:MULTISPECIES: hypothetical protein [unclassified Paenibacillus]QID16024.1 hypothetical protein CIC07_25155 [Paenibacillus sp. RUD330]
MWDELNSGYSHCTASLFRQPSNDDCGLRHDPACGGKPPGGTDSFEKERDLFLFGHNIFWK